MNDSLEERVARLEQSVRRYRLCSMGAGIVVAVLLLCGWQAETKVPKQVVAQSFILKSSAGSVMGRWTAEGNNRSAKLLMENSEESVALALAAKPSTDSIVSGLVVHNKETHDSVIAGTGLVSSLSLLSISNGKSKGFFGINNSGVVYLDLYNLTGKRTIVLGSDGSDRGTIMTADSEGKMTGQLGMWPLAPKEPSTR